MSAQADNAKSAFEDKLKASVALRAQLMHRLGFMPFSVLKLTRGALSKSMFTYQQELRGRSISGDPDYLIGLHKSADGKTRAEERKRLGLMGGVLESRKNGQRTNASIMAAELVDFFIKYFAKPGDTYLDPFMGQGVQMQVAKLRGLHYTGMDLSTEFFKYIAATKTKIDDGKTRIDIMHGDSRDPSWIADGVGDFGFTSPPYYDIEYYGDEPEQLSKCETYEAFLAGMEVIAREWLPKFKQGAYYVVNVNDFRRGGDFHAYHADTIALHQRAGWKLHDIWIIDGLIAGLPRMFAARWNSRRIAPKMHEYGLVFRRP